MSETSYFWGGTATGDATRAPYDNTELSQFFNIMFCRYPYTGEGVIYGYLNSLEVTNPSGNQILVNTGAAMVNGYLYINSESVAFSVSDPGGGDTNYYTLRVQCNTTTQTIRLALGDPALDTWPVRTWLSPTFEIQLAHISITGGVVTLIDSRYYLHTPAMLDGVQLDNDSVDYTKAGDGLPYLIDRIGNSNINWATPTTLSGSPTYMTSGVVMQCGSTQVDINTGAHTVAFVTAFSGTPLVFIQSTYAVTDYWAAPTDITTTGFTITTTVATLSDNVPYFWIAIGPA